ncbi:flagellin lysine-N-methylase [Clostridium algidicarnis]|uniref:flagellin lysine-N-methylase n=1 Tax=Clostridium algidicarnis TaxID=37659 RepID=UPI003FD7DCB2
MNETLTMLTPSYMKDFKCIGQRCEESCCYGWNVDLDKKTYKKYITNQNEKLRPLFQTMINRRHNNKSDVNYAKIKMDSNKGCPFLDENKLCNIHKELGEDYMSDTCSDYPRYTRKVDGMLEQSATISCPEVARLALLNKEGIILEQIELDKNSRIFINNGLNTEGYLLANRLEKYFWDIRIFNISLLQNRNYSLDDRLIIMGIIYKKIEKLNHEGNNRDIPAMLNVMNDLMKDDSLKQQLKGIPKNTAIQMKITKELTDKKVLSGVGSERYLECVIETLNGLGFIEGAKLEDVVEKYDDNYNKYFKTYIEEKQYILENYLVNEYFRELMPFGSFNTIWDSYIYIVSIYSMIKLHLIGMSGYHHGLDDELTLKLIQSFSRVVVHTPSYIQSIIKLIKDSGFDSLAHMSILIKS